MVLRLAAPAKREPFLLLPYFLRQIAEEVLQVNQIGRIFDQALREQIVRVVVVGLFGAALGRARKRPAIVAAPPR